MGFKKSKRPLDLRTSASTDLKFHYAISTGTLVVPNISSTTLLTAPTISSTAAITAEAVSSTGYLQARMYGRNSFTSSTAASTALSARGVIELGTSSTSAAGNWILTAPTAGDEITVLVKLNGSTFGVTVNASTATAVNFGAVTATTDQIRITVPGVLGNGFQAVAVSTSRWLVVNHQGCSFSTAAA